MQKAAAFSYATNVTYSDTQLDLDIQMLQRIQPKWLRRIAGERRAGIDDTWEFSRAVVIADRIHNEVSPYIIFQATLFENIEPSISDWNVIIPDYVLAAYGYPTYVGFTGYFEHDNIVYEEEDVLDDKNKDVPDMNKIEAQMWFYYHATHYIDAGYEAHHVGQFMEMNNNNPLNSKLDIIGFDNNGVKVAKSNGSSFNSAYYASNLFGNLDGWNPTKHVREVGDFTGDGLIDIIGCWDNNKKVRKSNGTNFIITSPHSDIWSNDFCYNTGWRMEKHLRLIGDVNGDGKDDIVGFKDDDVYVGILIGTEFVTDIWYAGNFCFNQGWDNNTDQRFLADVNGDGMADIVGYGYWGVQVALSTGTSFSQAEIWIYNFGAHAAVGGWSTSLHTRGCADINGDGMADLVGFGNVGTIVSLSTGKSFSKIEIFADFNYPVYNNLDNPRILADMDADGRSEVIAYGESQVYLLNCNIASATFKSNSTVGDSNFEILNVFPNPTAGIINIEFENPIKGDLIIADLQGQIIFKETYNVPNRYRSVLLNNTPNGIYIITFLSEDMLIQSKKLILMK